MNRQYLSDSQPAKPKLLDQMRTTIRLRGMSYSTEQTYTDWVKRFIISARQARQKQIARADNPPPLTAPSCASRRAAISFDWFYRQESSSLTNTPGENE